MSHLNILVVGASIAGPMTAYWLAKTGAHVTVIERFPELRKGGQNIDIRTIGVTVMRKIPGLENSVRASLAPVDGMAFVRDDGSVIGTMTDTGDADQQSLVSEFEIYRGELSRLICDLTKDNDRVRYIFNEQVIAIQQSPSDGPVRVAFANETPTQDFDLVVACDGATSRTRSIGLGCGVRDYVHPIGAWVAYWSIKEDVLRGSRVFKAISAPAAALLVSLSIQVVRTEPWHRAPIRALMTRCLRLFEKLRSWEGTT